MRFLEPVSPVLSTSSLEGAYVSDSIQQDMANAKSGDSTFFYGNDDINLLEGASFVATVEHHAEDLDELFVEAGDVIEVTYIPGQNFWLWGTQKSLGARRGHSGFFPRFCIVQPPEVDEPLTDFSFEPLRVLKIAKALFEYQPKRQDELCLVAGDIIIVLEIHSGGWWKGLSYGFSIGWFPHNLCTIIQTFQNSPQKEAPLEVEIGNPDISVDFYDPDLPRPEESGRKSVMRGPETFDS